jgi:histidinol phosphatase-like PHP family hydrolase
MRPSCQPVYEGTMLTDAEIAELLVRAAAEESGHRQRALSRAARAAVMTWTEEAADVVEAPGRSLTELPQVGPWMARQILRWLEEPPPPELREPPALRRGFLTLSEVTRTLEANPDWPEDLRADLQMHTTFSDGKASIEEMAGHCAERGYEFVAITDHSKSLRVARGQDEERLAIAGEELDRVNASLAGAGVGLRLLKGIEMDLDAEGQGDMEPAALARLDLVLGAFHTGLRLEEDQTDRYLKALSNPTVHVIAHPRARKYDRRVGLRADWERVVHAAAEHDKALEIDAHFDRQDLDVATLELAREAGCRISIGTDAHYPWELSVMPFGLAAAIRAGIAKDRVLNLQPVDDVLDWARSAGG